MIAAVDDLPRTSNVRTQQMALWTTGISLVILLIAYAAFPGFWPPMSPQLSADEVATFYREHTASIRFSMVTFNLCGIMLLPMFGVIVVQMKRMTNQSQVFAYVFLSATVSCSTIFALSDIFFATAAFRPNRDPEIVMVLNDLGWLVFVAPVGMALVQNIMLALAVYHDNGPGAIFPRWVGHFSLGVAIAMAPSALSVAFDAGPFAWNGVISFWLRNIAFGTFVVVMLVVLRKTVHQQAVDEGLFQ